MINYEKAKERALKIDGSVNAARDVGIGWIFENSESGDGGPFLMIKKDGDAVEDILDFLKDKLLQITNPYLEPAAKIALTLLS